MTNPQGAAAPASPRIRSEYHPDNRPQLVKNWETWVESAPTDLSALMQLAYAQALQLRVIKLVLIWTMVVLPILFTVGLIVLTQTLAPPKTTF